MSTMEVILEGGSALTESTKAYTDISTNSPRSPEAAGALFSLAGVVFGLVGKIDSPFAKALGAGVGVNAGALGVVISGIQLGSAIDQYRDAMAGYDGAAQQIAYENLADKTCGIIAGIGGTIAAIPGLQPLGLSIWFGASLAQQYTNGNFGRLIDFFEVQTGLRPMPQVINGTYSAAHTWFPRRDPLTLDLDGDGLETVGIDAANPILFDHDGDGVKNATGWIQPDDGFLVLDRNGDGLINDGSELFGDSTPLHDANGEVTGKAADGFAALAAQDSNGDGLVNAQDANWAHLRVWQDADSDGVTDEGELKSLESLGIAGLVVAKSENTTILANGNQIADLGHFIKSDGSEGTLGNVTGGMADIDLADNPFYRSFGDTIALTEEAKVLPDMQGSGALRDLREASTLSPELAAAVVGYAAADTEAGGNALDNTITGSSGNNVLSRSVTMAGGAGNTLGCVRVRKAWRRMNLREKMILDPLGIYARSYRKHGEWVNASWVVLDVDLGERS